MRMCGYGIEQCVLQQYMEKVTRGEPAIPQNEIGKRIVNAIKNPASQPVRHNDVLYTPVVFRNGNDRRYWLVSDEGLIFSLITAKEYGEKYG